jgi:geranylgeranyl diphosphate synthase type I
MSDELRERFDAALAAFIDRQDPRWPDGSPRGVTNTLRRFVLAGGKRLRPMFCYWGWRSAGGADSDEVITAAAALELFHAFALIHDDIIDGSDRRRGQPSMHQLFADLHARSAWRGDHRAFGRSTAARPGPSRCSTSAGSRRGASIRRTAYSRRCAPR